MTKVTRRDVLKTGAGAAAIYLVDGFEHWLTPAAARAANAALTALTPAEAAIAEAFADAMVPGAKAGGIAHYLDRQLTVPAEESFLMLRYFDWPPPYLDFYRGSFAALDAYARSAHGAGAAELPADKLLSVAGAIGATVPDGWGGPPAPLFYFTFRADAIDVVYGTQEGIEGLGMPYVPHIVPPRKW